MTLTWKLSQEMHLWECSLESYLGFTRYYVPTCQLFFVLRSDITTLRFSQKRVHKCHTSGKELSKITDIAVLESLELRISFVTQPGWATFLKALIQ